MWKNPELRADARFHLKGAWGNAVAITLIAMLINSTLQSVVGLITGTGTVISIFTNTMMNIGQDANEAEVLRQFMELTNTIWVTSLIAGITSFVISVFFTLPFAVSVNNWFVRNRETPASPSLTMVFQHFSGNYVKLLVGRLWETLWITIWSIPYLAGAGIMMFMSLGIFQNIEEINGEVIFSGEEPSLALLAVAVLLVLLGMVPFINRSLAYAMNQFILADNPQIGAKRSLELSKKMMKGNKLHLIGLNFSFLGWILLAGLTCGLGNLVLTPYINQTMAELYARLRSISVARGDTTMEELGFTATNPVFDGQAPVLNPYQSGWQVPGNPTNTPDYSNEYKGNAYQPGQNPAGNTYGQNTGSDTTDQRNNPYNGPDLE